MFHHVFRLIAFATVTLLTIDCALAEQPSSLQGNWPQWRGPDRSNICPETGLLKKWPAGGPPLLWKAEGLGEGVPSISVAGGKVFILGYREGKEYLTALDERAGAVLWSAEIGEAVREISRMRWLSQRTPTVDGDRVYAIRANGELLCLGTADGKVRWQKSYSKDFEAPRPLCGFSDYPLVDGDRLICTPGGEKATVVALNKVSGKVLWTCAVPGGEKASYAAAAVAEVGTLRQYVNFLSKGVIGVSADGKFLWRYDRLGNNFANTYTPIVLGDLVFCASGYKSGYCLLQLIPERGGITVREIYTVQISLQPWLSSLVSQGECVLLCTGGDGMIAVEFRTGKVLWRAGKTSRSDQDAMVFADSHAYLRNSAGRVLLAAVTNKGLVAKGEFVPPRPGTTEPTWTFPVITGGRLYLRDQGLLLCYDLRDKVSRRRPDVIFVPTPQDVVEKMLELANVKKNDVVADLGCGDGRIVITAAKKYACKAVGYDLDDECVRLSLDQVKAARVEKLVRVEHKDIFDVDLTGVTVVAVYLGPTLNEKLIPQFKKMKPGSRIVSHAFEIPGIKPDRVAELTSEEDGVAHKIYGWTTPFPASVEARRARAHVGH